MERAQYSRNMKSGIKIESSTGLQFRATAKKRMLKRPTRSISSTTSAKNCQFFMHTPKFSEKYADPFADLSNTARRIQINQEYGTRVPHLQLAKIGKSNIRKSSLSWMEDCLRANFPHSQKDRENSHTNSSNPQNIDAWPHQKSIANNENSKENNILTSSKRVDIGANKYSGISSVNIKKQMPLDAGFKTSCDQSTNNYTHNRTRNKSQNLGLLRLKQGETLISSKAQQNLSTLSNSTMDNHWNDNNSTKSLYKWKRPLAFLKKKIPIDSQAKRFSISDFELELNRGQDIYGTIYPARHLETGFLLCIKIINKKDIKPELDKFIQTVKIQALLSSEHSVQTYGIFEENDKIYQLLEYFEEGGLLVKLKSRQGIKTLDALAYTKQISMSIRELHQKNIVHRNLKPESISLLYNTCKICNFNRASEQKKQINNFVGTIEYCSPEILYGSKNGKEDDVWSLGVILYEMLTGVTPCRNRSRKQAIKRIQNCEFAYPDEIPSRISHFLKQILCKKADGRLSIFKAQKQLKLVEAELEKEE